SAAIRYSQPPPNGNVLSAMRVTRRRGGSALSTTIVIAPFDVNSRHDAPVEVGGSSSTRVTPERQLAKPSGCVIADQTAAGGAAMRADSVTTWSRGSSAPIITMITTIATITPPMIKIHFIERSLERGGAERECS